MADKFSECWKRLDRADAHGHAFVDGCNDFLARKPYDTIQEMRDDRNGVIKIVLNEDVDWALSLILGEFFYQLRAVLDSVVWQAYLMTGGTESSPQAKDVYFPLCAKPSTFQNAAINLRYLPDSLKLWLRKVQPCYAGEFAYDPDAVAIREALEIIHRCAKADRHRRLHVVAAHLADVTASVEATPPAHVAYCTTTKAAFFEKEAIVALFGISGNDPETKIRTNGNFTVQISIKEVAPEPGADVAHQLLHLANVVRFTVLTFEEAFE